MFLFNLRKQEKTRRTFLASCGISQESVGVFLWCDKIFRKLSLQKAFEVELYEL